MHRIASYIERLLTQHDCVMIPSLGALIKETLPPSYQACERIAYPGKDIFHFNPELKDRDNLLDGLYARNYGISLRRARLMVDRDIEELREILTTSGIVNLGKPGYLRIDEGGILFIPRNAETYLGSGENYGLVPYTLPQRFQEGAGKVSQKAPTPKEKATPPKKHSDGYLYFRVHKRIASAAAVLITLLVILIPTNFSPVLNRYSAGFVKTEISPSETTQKGEDSFIIERNRADAVPYNGIKSQEKASTVKTSSATIKRLVPTPKSAIPESPQTSVPAGKYYVVIGAFYSEGKTKDFVSSCQSSSFFPTMGYFKRGERYMIYAYSTESSASAMQFIRQLREIHLDKRDAWVLHINAAP